MNAEFISGYIPRRMKELGYGDNYFMRFRHLVLKPAESIEVNASSDLFLLTEEVPDIRISSEYGVFDLSTDAASEMQYEHSGLIEIVNGSHAELRHVKLVQVIPYNLSNTESNG